MSVTLSVATDADLRWVERAVRACPVAMAEFGGFYGEASVKIPAIQQSGLESGHELLIVRERGEPVGFVDTDDDLAPGSMAEGADLTVPTIGLAWFVVPERRGQHLMATALEVLGERRPSYRLQAAIDADNGPSLGAARRAGFVDVGPNSWGERVLLRPAVESSARGGA